MLFGWVGKKTVSVVTTLLLNTILKIDKNKIMKKITTIISLLLLHNFIHAQATGNNKNTGIKKTNPIVGTWRLVEFADLDSITHVWKYRYGKNPRGFFTYTKNGVLNLNISSDNPPKISEDSAKHHNMNLFNFIDNISVGYFGTYTVDEKNSTVIHHVKGGSILWYIDTDQPRKFQLRADTLTIGDNKTWKRVLVRAD